MFKSRKRWAPRCSACKQGGLYDHTGQVRRAVVRVEFSQEPYGARLCAPHLSLLERSHLPGGVRVVERYD